MEAFVKYCTCKILLTDPSHEEFAIKFAYDEYRLF